jgi:ATP-dependent RNA helicase RhlE
VEESIRTYGRHLSLKTGVVYGGVGIGPQIGQLRRGVDILVATPGRLLDHATRRTLDLSRVEILVLDEADRMLDMGFLPDVRKILAMLPKDRQNLLSRIAAMRGPADYGTAKVLSTYEKEDDLK